MSKVYESEFEEFVIEKFKNLGWQYSHGDDLRRDLSETLIIEDLRDYLTTLPLIDSLTNSEIDRIVGNLKNTSSSSEYLTVRSIFQLIQNGFTFDRDDCSKPSVHIDYLNFDRPEGNIFRAVNQFTVRERGQERRPDILLFVNGIPLCILELKNPASEEATVRSAWEQIHIRYRRDIPSLMKYCVLSVVSDGGTSLLGTPFSELEYYYAWKKVSNEEKASRGLKETDTLIRGALPPQRFLSLIRDFVFFPDVKEVQQKEIEFVCRYPQFFATGKLYDNILAHLKTKEDGDGKGGTYFGATGCGKIMTMLFLARQLVKRSNLNPTILIIVDREDLETQTGKQFIAATDFLGDQSIRTIASRDDLKRELSVRQSGGGFITTVQKFCEETGLLSERSNVICLSDEAHRPPSSLGMTIKVDKEKKVVSEHRGFAQFLHDAFPNATFVGFSGTPLAETVQVFGHVVDKYSMQQSVEDGITVPLHYEARLARVFLNENQVKEIEDYYRECAEDGASEEAIEKSKRAMSSMELILGDKDRLKRLATDLTTHYENFISEKPDLVQKAMILCSNRTIAYDLYQEIAKLKPEWVTERRAPDELKFQTPEQKAELETLDAIPKLNLVATRSPNDPKEMFELLGDKKHRQKLDRLFKNPKSNFQIAIVVDMWITGFDVPSLAVLYNDKPLKRHTLIQAISRVNRRYPGKEFGLVVDYLGIRSNMKKALKIFDTEEGDGTDPEPKPDPIEEAKNAYKVFANTLAALRELIHEFDASEFFKEQGIRRFECLQEAEDFVLRQPSTGEKDSNGKEISFVKQFSSLVKRLRASYSICKNSEELSDEEVDWTHFFMAVVSLIAKTSDTGVSVETMNKTVEAMVHAALQCNGVETVLNATKAEEIFSKSFLKELEKQVKPNSRFQLLVKMLQKEIREYGKTNGLKAKEFSERLKEIVDRYNNRDHLTFTNEVVADVINDVIALQAKVQEDRLSFQKLGISFEEKAFFDILQSQKEKHGFEYSEDKMIKLAREIKTLIEYVPTANWLDNNNLKNQVQFDLTALLYENGYPPTWNREVFEKVIEQVENYKKYQ